MQTKSNTDLKKKVHVELFYSGLESVTIIDDKDSEHIYVHCPNSVYYSSLLRYLTNKHKLTGAEIHLPPEIADAAADTGFDELFKKKY